MQNAHISSTIAFRSKGSLYYSLNDHYLSNNRLWNTNSSCCSCSCCAFPFHGVPISPISPRCLYGLRQSTLIHLSAIRRLILGRGGRLFRLPVNNLDSGCYEKSYLESRRCVKRRGREGVGRRIRCMVWEEEEEEESENFDLGIDGTVEAMLSLLTDGVDESFYEVGKRYGRLERGVKTEKGRRNVSDFRREEEKYVECDCSERRLSGKLESVNVESKKEDKYVESDSVKRSSGRKLDSVNVKSMVDSSLYGGREGSLRGENSGLRKEVSNSSSYYSALSSDDIDESDADVKIKHERFTGESLSKNKSEDKRRRDSVYAKNVRRQSSSYENDVRKNNEEVKIRGDSERESLRSDWHSRNESERKRIDISIQQTESRKQSSENFRNVREVHESVSETVSSPKMRSSGREGRLTSSMESAGEMREQFRETGERVSQHTRSRRESQEFTEMSHIRDIEIEGPSISLTLGGWENLTESTKPVQEVRETYPPTSHVNNRENESRKTPQQLARLLKTNESDIRSSSSSQQLSEVTLKNRDDSSTSLVESKGRQSQTDQLVIGRTQSEKESQDLTKTSASCVSDTATVSNTKKHYESRSSFRERKSSTTMDSVEEAIKEKSLATEQVHHKGGSSKESQRCTQLPSFRESSSEKPSSSLAPFSLDQQAAVLQVNEQQENRSSEVIMTPPRSQFVKRTSRESILYREPIHGYATEEVSPATSASESTTLSTEERTPDFSLDLDDGTRRIHEEHSDLMFHEDALGSVNRLEESSTQFVGEFTEKLRHEGLTSALVEETISSQTTSAYNDERHTQQDSSQQVSGDFQSQVHGSKKSSFGSGARGPSDEMWDVAGPSSREPSRIEAPREVTPSTGSTIVRTGRSLWSVIADIVRMRWGTQSEIHKSTMKSGVKSSSNESMGSEVWFSSHETDDKDDENFKKGKRVTTKVELSSDRRYLEKSSAESQRETSVELASDKKIVQIEADKSSSFGSEQSNLASREETFTRKDLKRGQTISSSSTSKTDSSLPLSTRRLIRSPPLIEEISESSIAEVSSSGLVEERETVRENPDDTSGTQVNDGELKRRKLQRSKQVLQERFEEWEEAYRLESEQRSIDEIFMREALLEARRAADTWEVPVGAVLVKQGKIIARGCNLVEELRDSTAHAEMICIREASNVLRTWRLADTTLYVTLEPCAMCAGAILQARIDTVVWGAPNKLLGADGSWVRLLPGGGEGSGSDLSNQPAGPVHPFHPKMTIRRGILSNECADVMQQFFQLRRKKEKKPSSPPTSCLPISTHPSKFISKMHDIFNIMFCM